MPVLMHAFLASVLAGGGACLAPLPHQLHDIYGDQLPPGVVARIGTTRLRAPVSIHHVAISPDGKLLVTASERGPLQVWDATTGRPGRSIPTAEYRRPADRLPEEFNRPVPEAVAALAFAPDSRRLHVLSRNGILRTCDVTTETWSDPLARTPTPVTDYFEESTAGGWVSPTGTHFAYSPRNKPWRVEVFTVGKEKPVLVLKDEQFGEWGRGCVFSHDAKLVAVGLTDGSFRVCEVATGKAVATYPKPGSAQWEFTHSFDFKTFTTKPEPGKQCWGFAFSPDGKTVAAVYGPDDRLIRIGEDSILVAWDTATGDERFRVRGWRGSHVSYSPDGTKLLSFADHEVLISDPATGKLTSTLRVPGFRHFWQHTFSADGKKLVTAGGGQVIVVWDLETGKPVLDFDGPRSPVTLLAYSPDGKTLLTDGAGDDSAELWDPETGHRRRRLAVSPPGKAWSGPLSAAFTPDGEHVVVGYGQGRTTGTGSDWVARAWGVSDGKLVREFPGHTNGVHQVLVSPNGKQVVTRDWSKKVQVRLWDFDSGKLSREVTWAEYNYPTLLAYTRTGDLIGATSDPWGKNETISFPSGKVLGTWKQGDRCDALALSADGRLLLTKEHNRETGEQIHVRKATTGEIVCKLPLDRERVDHNSSIAFSPDMQTVAVSVSLRNVVHLFEVATGRELRTIRGHTGWVHAVAFSPDGKRLATCGSDCTVLIWDLTAKP